VNARTQAAGEDDDEDARFERGHRIADRYEIDAVLGEGASSVVYLAHRIGRDERFALKVIHKHLCGDRQIFGRYRREASILKRLEGPHMARMLDFIEEDDLLVIVLELVEGRTLESHLKELGAVDTPTAIEIALQVCATLGVAHTAGVVHRDLKPANVMLELQPGHGRVESAGVDSIKVRVVDFGLAKVVHGEHMTTGLTEHDMIFGTAEYMAPEQARGDDVDARTDIYAVGIMLYEMLTGEVPFSEPTAIATMTAHLTETPKSPREAAPDQKIRTPIETLILKALAKDADDRYPTARVLAEALITARDQSVIRAASEPDLGDHDLEMGDTTLSLETAELAHSPTIPGPPLEPEPKSAESTPPSTPHPAPESGHSQRVWLLVAVVAAVAAIAAGLALGGKP